MQSDLFTVFSQIQNESDISPVRKTFTVWCLHCKRCTEVPAKTKKPCGNCGCPDTVNGRPTEEMYRKYYEMNGGDEWWKQK